jgi:hypothetical protein
MIEVISNYTIKIKCDNLLLGISYPDRFCLYTFDTSPTIVIPVKSRLAPIALDSSIEVLYLRKH